MDEDDEDSFLEQKNLSLENIDPDPEDNDIPPLGGIDEKKDLPGCIF